MYEFHRYFSRAERTEVEIGLDGLLCKQFEELNTEFSSEMAIK